MYACSCCVLALSQCNAATRARPDTRRHAIWLWLDCIACDHRRPVLIVHLQIALGTHAGLDRVRAVATCPACGQRGALTYLPSHQDSVAGMAGWPGNVSADFVDSETGATPWPGYCLGKGAGRVVPQKTATGSTPCRAAGAQSDAHSSYGGKWRRANHDLYRVGQIAWLATAVSRKKRPNLRLLQAGNENRASASQNRAAPRSPRPRERGDKLAAEHRTSQRGRTAIQVRVM